MLPRRVAPKKVSDLKCVPYKNASMTLTFFSSNFRSFHVRSFTYRSNIFKNVFYVYVFFWNDGIFIDNSVCSCERVPREQCLGLGTKGLKQLMEIFIL